MVPSYLVVPLLQLGHVVIHLLAVVQIVNKVFDSILACLFGQFLSLSIILLSSLKQLDFSLDTIFICHEIYGLPIKLDSLLKNLLELFKLPD